MFVRVRCDVSYPLTSLLPCPHGVPDGTFSPVISDLFLPEPSPLHIDLIHGLLLFLFFFSKIFMRLVKKKIILKRNPRRGANT